MCKTGRCLQAGQNRAGQGRAHNSQRCSTALVIMLRKPLAPHSISDDNPQPALCLCSAGRQPPAAQHAHADNHHAHAQGQTDRQQLFKYLQLTYIPGLNNNSSSSSSTTLLACVIVHQGGDGDRHHWRTSQGCAISALSPFDTDSDSSLSLRSLS